MKRVSFSKQSTLRDWVTPLWLRDGRILWLGPIRIDLSRG